MKNLEIKCPKDVYVDGCKECYNKEEFGNFQSFRQLVLDKQEQFGATSSENGTQSNLHI